MTGYLLDTNVISAFAPDKVPVSSNVTAWFEAQTDCLFLSAVSLAEIEAGIAKLGRSGAARRASDLTEWLDRLLALYANKTLAFDVSAARLAGPIADRAKASGHDPGFTDIAIAAIARAHGLAILTRNSRHFRPLGSMLLDPFEDALPADPPSDSQAVLGTCLD